MRRTEHDDISLVGKYRVYKVVKRNYGAPHDLVEKRTASFVLSPAKLDDYGRASRAALRAYAKVIERRNPKLARDLRSWARRIERPRDVLPNDLYSRGGGR